jgi:hypothetical protein
MSGTCVLRLPRTCPGLPARLHAARRELLCPCSASAGVCPAAMSWMTRDAGWVMKSFFITVFTGDLTWCCPPDGGGRIAGGPLRWRRAQDEPVHGGDGVGAAGCGRQPGLFRRGDCRLPGLAVGGPCPGRVGTVFAHGAGVLLFDFVPHVDVRAGEDDKVRGGRRGRPGCQAGRWRRSATWWTPPVQWRSPHLPAGPEPRPRELEAPHRVYGTPPLDKDYLFQHIFVLTHKHQHEGWSLSGTSLPRPTENGAMSHAHDNQPA